jgi:uncharacterized protein YndB with AHSA1/START domain
MDPLATLETIGDKVVLRFERRLPHPPGKVFAAISDPAELAHWFPARVQWELRPHAAIEFRFEDVDVDAPGGEIVEVDPPKLLVYTWGEDVLRWEVVPDGEGSLLHFSHTIAGDDDWPARLSAARNAAGWDDRLAALEARLRGGAPSAVDWFERNAVYVERFGLGDGELLDGGRVVRFARDLVQPPARVRELLEERAKASAAGAVARVRWELRELPWGTGLVLTLTFPPGSEDLAPTALAEWRAHLDALTAQLHGVER